MSEHPTFPQPSWQSWLGEISESAACVKTPSLLSIATSDRDSSEESIEDNKIGWKTARKRLNFGPVPNPSMNVEKDESKNIKKRQSISHFNINEATRRKHDRRSYSSQLKNSLPSYRINKHLTKTESALPDYANTPVYTVKKDDGTDNNGQSLKTFLSDTYRIAPGNLDLILLNQLNILKQRSEQSKINSNFQKKSETNGILLKPNDELDNLIVEVESNEDALDTETTEDQLEKYDSGESVLVKNELNGILTSTLKKMNGNYVSGKEIDNYGFVITDNHKPIFFSENQKYHIKWQKILNKYQKSGVLPRSNVRHLCKHGIPPSLRGQVWKILLKANAPNIQNYDFFSQIDLLELDSKTQESILKDLNRQIPNHKLFFNSDQQSNKGVTPKYNELNQGQKMLYRTLKALALFDKQSGYCQAHAPLASVLLIHTYDPEQSFWMLFQVCSVYLPGYYTNDLIGYWRDSKVFALYMKSYAKKASQMLYEIDLPDSFLIEWLMCAYTRTFTFQNSMRIFDLFLCCGSKILFRIGYALLEALAELKPTNADQFFGLLRRLKNEPDLLDIDKIISKAQKMTSLSNAKIRKGRKHVNKQKGRYQ